MLSDFISAALVEQPMDVFEFARQHFKGTAKPVPEDMLQSGGDDGSGGGGAGDQDDLDDLDDMAAGSSQLTEHLKAVFDSIDTDGSGSISKEELKKKLETDTELQTLLANAGGDGSFFVLEQLDLDGDGEVTWMEFEAMLGDR